MGTAWASRQGARNAVGRISVLMQPGDTPADLQAAVPSLFAIPYCVMRYYSIRRPAGRSVTIIMGTNFMMGPILSNALDHDPDLRYRRTEIK